LLIKYIEVAVAARAKILLAKKSFDENKIRNKNMPR
jgi:hypothetical protein